MMSENVSIHTLMTCYRRKRLDFASQGKSKGSSPVLHEETAGTRRRISKNGRKKLAGSLLGSGGRRRLRCHPAEGVEIGPDMLHGLLVKSLDRSISAL